MPSSRKSICAGLTTLEENDSQSDHDTDLDDTVTLEIGSDYEVSSESDEDDEWKGRLNYTISSNHYTDLYDTILLLGAFFDEITTTEVISDYHPFPSKAAALIYVLVNSPTPIVCQITIGVYFHAYRENYPYI